MGNRHQLFVIARTGDRYRSLAVVATVIGPLPGMIFGAACVAAETMNVAWPLDFPPMEIGECSIVVVDEFHPFGKEEKEGNMRPGDSEEESGLAVATKESTGYKVESMKDLSGRSGGEKTGGEIARGVGVLEVESGECGVLG